MGTIIQSWEELSSLTDEQMLMVGWNKTLPTIGDTKEVSFLFEGEKINAVMKLVGINHDELSDGGRAHFSFLCDDVYLKHRMSVVGADTGGWTYSELRSWLHTDILLSMPMDLQPYIKPVKKISDDGVHGRKKVTNDSLWIPSYREVHGSSPSFVSCPQGKLYTTFTDLGSKVKESFGEPTDWWMRSSGVSDGKFWIINRSGYSHQDSANTCHGVVFGFCI